MIQASFRGHQNRRQQEKADKAKAKADAELTQQMEKLKTKVNKYIFLTKYFVIAFK